MLHVLYSVISLKKSVIEREAVRKMTQVRVHSQGKEEACTIMVVDEDEAMRAVLVDALQGKGCQVVESHNGKGALETVKTVKPNVIVTDLKITDGGYPYLRLLKAAAPESCIVVMTAYGDSQSKGKVLECGAHGYFEKPLHLKDLQAWICQSCMNSPCRNLSL